MGLIETSYVQKYITALFQFPFIYGHSTSRTKVEVSFRLRIISFAILFRNKQCQTKNITPATTIIFVLL